MKEEEFWSLIDLLGGSANRRTTPGFIEALTREGVDRVNEFAEILTRKIQLLEGQCFWGTPARDVSDPPDAAPVPLTGDALTNFHFAVVAAGRSRFHQIQGHLARVTDQAWDFSESSELADSVSAAYENCTGEPWRGPLPGFNMDEAEEPTAGAAGDTLWLNLAVHGEIDIPTAYYDAAGAVIEVVQNDPQWRAWWLHATQSELVIEIAYTTQEERGSVHTRKGRAWASFCRNRSRLRGLNKGGLAYLAAMDMEAVLTLVSTSLSLPKPPQVPLPVDATPPTRKDEAARARLQELRERHRKQI
ncbi:hypothetical protein [Streptomyces cinereoruber]|uniref:hypothetical protein n=1 Tax=Streptomyces cinereoruber TaxID=67260 RepID=UPI003C2F2ECB